VNSETGPAFRAGDAWIDHQWSVVPDIYGSGARCQDAIPFIFSRLSSPRLAENIRTVQLAPDAPAEARLMVISRMPGLPKQARCWPESISIRFCAGVIDAGNGIGREFEIRGVIERELGARWRRFVQIEPRNFL
jgi:hypothetical protein